MLHLIQSLTCVLVYLVAFVHGFDNSSRLTERFLANGNTVSVSVDPNHSGNMVHERYLSFTIDSYEITVNLKRFHTSSNKFRNLAKALSPAYMRVGGTLADSISFRDHYGGDHVMSEWEFDTLYNFAHQVGWEMIFDLNLLMRKSGQWDSGNAEKLMRHAASKGYKLHLELGNEPNVYDHSKRVDPAQIGRDYGKLRQLMNSIPPFNNQLLLGPAVENHVQEDFAQKFLQTGSSSIHAFTYHHYYFSGKDAAAWKYMDPTTLNSFTKDVNKIWDAMKKASSHTRVMWLGETSSAWSQGPVDTLGFIHGFMWLDKLGMAGVHGINVVARQTFINMMDGNDNPVPDFWLSLLFKRLVGRKVLHVTNNEGNNRFRIYAHCSADKSHPHGVTFFYVNLYDADAELTAPQYNHQTYHLYSLTAGGNGALKSNTVKLNGHVLYLNGDNVPYLNPVTSLNWPVHVPKHSMGFLVLPDANAGICH